MVAGLGTILAAAAVAPALGAVNHNIMEHFNLEDPTIKYTKPPFRGTITEMAGFGR